MAASLDTTQTVIQKLEGTILLWSAGAESSYGWRREEAVGRNADELLASELPRPAAEIQAALLENGSWTGEYKQRHRDGSIVWVASSWTLHRNHRGQPVSVVRVHSDITALKHTSEATALSLFENASQGILTADLEGRIVNANAMVLGLFGYTRAEMIGAPVEMLLPEDARRLHVGHRAGYALNPRPRFMGRGLDLAARRKDGSEFPVEISLSYVAEHQSGGLAMAFISDITERKQADRHRESLIARLEGALAEKTVLLQKVHHRVKNNLAVIAGLLGMHADAVAEANAKIALGESQRRVASMALIHESFILFERMDSVNFGQYAQQLANDLHASFAVETELVRVGIEAEDIELPVHQAIPCALILNELLSNAFKYAFPRGRGGVIRVHFARLESGEFTLSCGDEEWVCRRASTGGIPSRWACGLSAF
jgi:PAS domain S-box-containing protein